MEKVKISNNDQIIMSLVHYFVTKENYSPIVVKGAKDEVWLENLNAKYKVIRINNNYIHNEEQYQFDLGKFNHVLSQIKRKTFSFKIYALNICLDSADRVEIGEYNTITSISIKKISDLKKNSIINTIFPKISMDIIEKTENLEDIKNVTSDINAVTMGRNVKLQELFAPKSNLMTYIIMAICILMFVITILTNFNLLYWGANFGEEVKNGGYYRLITSIFLHANFIHLFVNMYSLNILGKELENIVGRYKFIYIFMLSGLCGSLLSILINGNATFSVGASGAIFGLGSALIYFGYQYRLYLNKMLYSQLIPVLGINIIIGFMLTGIDNAAHIGGLIGGYLAASFVGIDKEVNKKERTNGFIATIVFLIFCFYLISR